MIGVDWGTSQLRAYRLADDSRGTILDRRESGDGVLAVEPGHFPDVLKEIAGSWIAEGERRILLSGTVGSRNGWRETRPVQCPVRLADLARAVEPVPFDEACVRIVPGVAGVDANGVPEVMRGEEVEIVGARIDAGCVCLPGSHSKWVRVEGGAIISYSTYLTGETYAALRAHTLLAKLMGPEPPVAGPAFDAGVSRSAEGGGVLHHLFGVRTLGLAGRITPAESQSYLSGLLIGHEIRSALAPSAAVTVVGASALVALYVRAIDACGGRATPGPEQAAARGLAMIGAQVAWTD
ncbi:MAG TPA: 2-dehydro-3-deoxygalactonokinase [Gemmatimonadaceae bacterium]|nr:2-dehydro-3-deoxygalactonokinase [Gemmatimonadaceae bacterium]